MFCLVAGVAAVAQGALGIFRQGKVDFQCRDLL